MKKNYLLLIPFFMILVNCKNSPKTGQLELVSELKERPGNVTASNNGRVFTTLHPLDNPKIQLVEIKGKNSFEPFPSLEIQKNGIADNEHFDAPFGIFMDKDNLLWTVDAGLELKKVRVFAFDINTKKMIHKIDIPENLIVEGSLVQELAVDKENMLVYLADVKGAIIFVDIKNNIFRRFEDPTMLPEDINMSIDNEPVYFGGNPIRIGIDPLYLSPDNKTIYFGSMNGTKLYSIETDNFKQNKSDNELSESIKVVFDKKPFTDGCVMDEQRNHYFTNLGNGSIDILTKDGEYKTLVKDNAFSWPDNVSFGTSNWLYISINQLHKSKSFNGVDKGVPPYKIMRVYTGTKAITN